MKVSKKLAWLPLVLATGLLFTGCASGAATPTTAPTDASTGDAALAAAKEVVAQYAQVPAPRQVAPLASTPDEGLELIFIGCAFPACAEVYEYYAAAAAKLGWTTRHVIPEFTPESVQAAFDSAIQLNPDGIEWLSILPIEVLDEQVRKAKEAGIPFIPVAAVAVGADDVGPDTGYAATILAGPDKERVGEIQAAYVIEQAAANGDTLDKVGYLYDPAPPAYVLEYEAFTRAIEAAGGSVVPLEVKQADVGGVLPGQVVAYLQSNPDVKYMGVSDDLLLPGVPDAIEGAGLEIPGFVGLDPQAENFQYIAEGRQLGSIMQDLQMVQWDTVDTFARIFTDDPNLNRAPLNEFMLVTKANVADAQQYKNNFPGVPDSYTAAWGVK